MAYEYKIGQGTDGAKSYSLSLPLEATITEEMKDDTLEQIIKAMAEQLEIKNGVMRINHIQFSFEKVTA